VKHYTRSAVSVIFPIVLACLLMAGPLLGQSSSGDSKSSPKPSASSIEIKPMEPGDLPIPPDFRAAVYENLIVQIQKTGKFEQVYRSGDKDAASVPNLVILRTVAQSFKKGSQKKREVTTVAGATSISLKVQITDHAGKMLVDRDVVGKVRFFGENLRATYDFSKKVAKIVQNTF
jgi:hypothetical protein